MKHEEHEAMMHDLTDPSGGALVDKVEEVCCMENDFYEDAERVNMDEPPMGRAHYGASQKKE